ncbi:glycosyltransferase [Candidatus Bipolaricaulota bacterium]|nr:glycosyltransferase [Candidatus Bipolaricaulota bacterium]
MLISFLNPQGNFDPEDSYWMEHPDFGGQLVYVKETALALAELGHRVDIVTRQFNDPDWPEFSERIDRYPESNDVRIVRIPCGPDEFLPKEQLWPHLGTDWLDGIIDFYESEGELPDVATTHYGDGGLVGALLKEETGIPYTFTGHSLGAQKMDRFNANRDNLEELDERFNFTRRIFAERVAMEGADRVITSTSQERYNQYDHPAYSGAVSVENDDKFTVIPPGVNRKVFNEEKGAEGERVARRIESALARDVSSERSGLPLVICSSRLDRKKNHLGLVKAFAQSEKLRESANLAIVVRAADNPLKERDSYEGEAKEILDEIASILEEKDLWEAVTSFPLENQQELAAAYRWSSDRKSVFALTALYEPFGLAPLEAMSCGLPAVVTNRGGPTESMVDSDTGEEFGVLVDPEDPEGIARGLLRLLDSEESWERFRQAGKARVLARYTWEETAKGYLKALKDIQDQPDRGKAELPIPDYFRNPSPETDIELERLADLYFT